MVRSFFPFQKYIVNSSESLGGNQCRLKIARNQRDVFMSMENPKNRTVTILQPEDNEIIS